MKALPAGLCVTMLLTAWGCTPFQKPGAGQVEPSPPAPRKKAPLRWVAEDESVVLAPVDREELKALPLSLETPVPALSYELKRSLMRPPHVEGRLDVPLKRRWKYIVIHHSATQSGSEAIFDRYHRRELGWRGVGYDFVIGNGSRSADGLVEVTFRWEQQIDGAHANQADYNQHGIGICLVGDFEHGYPTAKQMEALVGLVNYLQERCHIPTQNIVTHRHIRPGGTFPWYEFLSLLAH
jgi:N-acetylmuramoyl-L-alanine amidase